MTPSGRARTSAASLRAAASALRAGQWAHFALLPAAALGPGTGSAREVLRGVVIAALSLSYAYGVNAIADRGMDAAAAKNPLAGMAQTPPLVDSVVVGCGAGAIALAWSGCAAALVATLTGVAASTVYSVGPRLKSVPFLGTLLNVAIFAPLLAAGLDTGPRPPAFDASLAAFVALLLQNQLLHERADADEDRRARVFTTGLVLGERGTAAAVALIGAAGAAVAIAIAPTRALVAAAVATLLAASAASLRLRVPAARRRASHRLVSLAGGAALFAAGWIPPGSG